MKKNLKKLSLKKETIYSLNELEMNQLKGERFSNISCESYDLTCGGDGCNAIASFITFCKEPTPTPTPAYSNQCGGSNGCEDETVAAPCNPWTSYPCPTPDF